MSQHQAGIKTLSLDYLRKALYKSVFFFNLLLINLLANSLAILTNIVNIFKLSPL